MTKEKFTALIQRLDDYAQRQPAKYRFQVGLLASLGYAFIFLMLGLLLALAIGLITMMIREGRTNIVLIKLGFFLIVGIVLILRSLWVTIPPPCEPELTPQMAPRLFAMLNEVADKLQAPRFQHVQITLEFNAGVQQVPKLGLLGFQVSYLQIGLPLMQALSPDQFRSVIAHEMGHLSSNHSKFSGWIYRVRQTWFQLLQNLNESGHKAAFLFTAFFNWYAPYFAAYSFVLARADEYVADRCAAEVTGAKAAAEALIQTTVQGRFFETEFWPRLLEGARERAEPPPVRMMALVSAFTERMPDEAEQWYDEALEENTGLDDTHPSLSERLTALGYHVAEGGEISQFQRPLPLPALPAESAVDAYLGPEAAQISTTLDEDWKQQIAPLWHQHYEELQQIRNQLDTLKEQASQKPLPPKDAWERASLTAMLYGEEYAKPLIWEIAQTQPENAEANFALGQLLLKENDAQGVSFLKKAIALSSDTAAIGNELLYRFARRQGSLAEAAHYRECALQAQQTDEMAAIERIEITPADIFLSHGLEDEELIQFRAQISRYDQISKAYLVRKQVKYLPENPLYVLGIVPRGAEMPDLAARLGSELNFPGETVLIILNDSARKFEKPLARVTAALIYKR